MPSQNSLNKNIYIVSLGCPKNLVDSEFLLGLLTERGYKVTDDPLKAGVMAVNTCAFIRPAVEESIDTILELAALKQKGSASILLVVGCLPERYREDLISSLPEVDIFCGTGEIDQLPGLLDSWAAGQSQRRAPGAGPGFIPGASAPRLQSEPFFRAYLKIAEGCSNACSYCLIPGLRGPYRSRPVSDLLDEADSLAGAGVKELILVAQDTTAYGRDLNPPTDLSVLLTRLAEIRGLDWLRVMYAYPSGVTEKLIQIMIREPKICPYLDLPLQHSSPAVLKRMGRGRMADPADLLIRLKRVFPDLSLRTTLMVGFPGETEEDFSHLLEFVEKFRFDHLGVFKFSREQGTGAARFPNQISEEVKEERRAKIMTLQRSISREHNKNMVGQIEPVLVEGLSPETDLLLVGRTRTQAPEVDGQVIINKGEAKKGDIVPVLITESHDYDLIGEIVDG